MVSLYGMSKYGLLNLAELNVSSNDLLEEYQSISRKMESESMQILKDNQDKLERIANELIKKETLEEHELIFLFSESEDDDTKPENIKNEQELAD